MQRPFVAMIGLVIVLTIVTVDGCTSLDKRNANRGGPVAAAGSKECAALPQANVIELQGTVVYKDLQGGLFIIDGDDGKTYDPINLPEAFKKDGIRVHATIRARDDVGSIHMVGDIIEIVDIDAVE